MKILNDLFYTKNHEWVKIESNIATIGITDYAQGELGDIIFIELPNLGDKVLQNATIGTIEAVKTVADIYSPVTGIIEEINSSLDNDPDKINNDPYNSGWIAKIKDFEINKNNLLSSEDYKNIIK